MPAASAAWPPPLERRLLVSVTGTNPLVLLASSLTLRAAACARRRRDDARHLRRLWTAAALGALFLLVQGYEWVRLIGYGLSLASGIYGTTFFGLIGLHALHVVAALVWLLITTALVARRHFGEGRSAPVQACAMFWHFVVGVWPVLYVTVYLL